MDALVETGATEIIADDDPRFRARAVALLTGEHIGAERRAFADRIAATVPERVREAVRYAVAHGDQPRSVTALSVAIGTPRKSLDRRLSQELPMTARQLLMWGRLISAAMRMEASACTVLAAAGDLSFASPSALRNLLQRHAGMTPTELLRNGGSAHLVQLLTKRLARAS